MENYTVEMKIIARYYSPLEEKFGAPRQSGLVTALRGKIVFEPDFRSRDALRGIEDFEMLWVLWHFNANRHDMVSATVRPPRLGGNVRLGVWATRSPYRPNPIGLSAVKFERVDYNTTEGPVLYVSGGDMINGTPIFDIKPYLPYADSYPDVRAGFTDANKWDELEVSLSPEVLSALTNEQAEMLKGILALDPRPRYHNDNSRLYGIKFAGHDFHFTINENRLYCTM